MKDLKEKLSEMSDRPSEDLAADFEGLVEALEQSQTGINERDQKIAELQDRIEKLLELAGAIDVTDETSQPQPEVTL